MLNENDDFGSYITETMTAKFLNPMTVITSSFKAYIVKRIH